MLRLLAILESLARNLEQRPVLKFFFGSFLYVFFAFLASWFRCLAVSGFSYGKTLNPEAENLNPNAKSLNS